MQDLPRWPTRFRFAGPPPDGDHVLRYLPSDQCLDAGPVQSQRCAGKHLYGLSQRDQCDHQVKRPLYYGTLLRQLPQDCGLDACDLLPFGGCLSAWTVITNLRQLPHYQQRSHTAPDARLGPQQANTGGAVS